MPARTLSHPLLLSLALTLAGPALAQSTDKDPQAAPKQAAPKSSATRPAAAKRLDFVPSSNVKPTTTRPTTPAVQTPAQPPAKHDWNCDSESADA